MGAILSVLGSIILNLAGYAVSEANAAFGAKTKAKLTQLAKQIYSRMSKDQKKLDDLYEAYTNNRSALQGMLYSGSGFGPRIEAIYKELDNAKSKYDQVKDTLKDKVTEASNAYNEATNAAYQAGTSIVANIKGKEIADQMEQYVNGGLTKNE